jgi:hypothetical protein
VCSLILCLIITGLKGIHHLDQLYYCIFGMIPIVLILHLSHFCPNKRKNTSDKVNKSTTLNLHQQHYFDSSPTIFGIPIPAARIVSTTIAQENAEIFFQQ